MHLLFTQIGTLQLVGGLVLFVRTKVSALVLGPAGVGVVSVVDQFVQLMLQLSTFAIPFAAIKVLSKAHSESAEAFRATYAALVRLLLVLGSIGASLGMVLIAFQPSWLNTSMVGYTPLVTIGLLGLPAVILHGFFRIVPAAAMRPITSAVWDVVSAAIMAGAIIVGILLLREIGYFVGTLVGAVVVSASYYLYFTRRFGLSNTGPPTSVRGLLKGNPSFVKLSFTSYFLAFATPLALFIVRATVLDHFGEATAGFLQALIGISLAMTFVLSPLNGLLLAPLVNRTLPENEKRRETEAFQKKFLLVTTAVSLPLVLFPDLAVIALFSAQFVEAANTLYWFVLSQATIQIVGVYTALMIGLDLLTAYGAIMAVAPVANAALAILLVPRLGLVGAGIAALTSTSLLALTAFGYLHTRAGFRVGRAAGLGMLLLFVGLALGGAFVGTRSSLEVPNLVAKLLVGVTVLGLVAALSLDRDERRAVLARLGAASRRG
jgi:PST family polysaccharide transporter